MQNSEIFRRKLERLPVRVYAMATVVVVLALVLWLCFLSTSVFFVTSSQGVDYTVIANTFSPQPALTMAKVTVGEHDVVLCEQTPDSAKHLHVEHAVPVTLTVDGQTNTQWMVSGTIEQALDAFGVTLSELDQIEPALDVTFADGQNTDITVYRVQHVDYEINEVIPYETQYQYTSLFWRTPSYTLTMQEGVNGSRTGMLRDVMVDGVLTETIALTEEQVVEPVPEIIKQYGAGVPISDVPAPAGITVENNVPSSYTTVYDMRATGYSASRGKGASGLGLYYGTFAVDPTLIPYGTKVYITSADGKFVYGWAIATDTGAFIEHTRLQVDLFYETYAESVKNAVQQVKVYVP